jgi:hypothetical protein
MQVGPALKPPQPKFSMKPNPALNIAAVITLLLMSFALGLAVGRDQQQIPCLIYDPNNEHQ